MNTAFFTGISVLQPKNPFKRFIIEGITLTFSFVFTSYILSLLLPIYPVTANPVFEIGIIVYSLLATVMWDIEIIQQFLKKPINRKLIILVICSFLLVDIGLILVGWSFGMLPPLVAGIALVLFGMLNFMFVWETKKKMRLPQPVPYIS